MWCTLKMTGTSNNINVLHLFIYFWQCILSVILPNPIWICALLVTDCQFPRCPVRCRDTGTDGRMSVSRLGPSRHQQCISSQVSDLGLNYGMSHTVMDCKAHCSVFPRRTGSALALLYGTSATLEHHHFNHAVMILQSEVRLIPICLQCL